ncbi:CBS domain-containing protein [Chlorobium phaeobacteroides]|jgi:acetoin utilization protein AcuB|uniref:CBS domain containing protein n=1 Tax=Chlorobium phaeobacteroides (strain DSM 266 / SMG 266 / 2430) TaxID=290317 RepID=A1BG35_CHLPD|nr:CBS domain-containing protein [Chlorobium phaeobacteroides]ABL65362.1 CBS domain containing protein [Chlorobium phaeobacteroides DSM 266]MBV5327814.1 CBS domain-containing protein [Chlorobium sp.]
MLLKECIEDCVDRTYPFFEDDALASDVLLFMQENEWHCLPVLHKGRAVAVVTLADFLQLPSTKKKSAISLKEMQLKEVGSIAPEEHLFDLFERLRTFPYPIIPVSDESGQYIGVVSDVSVSGKISKIFHLGQEATTIELDLPSHSLKLSEVIASLEKSDATLLSFGSYFVDPEKERIVVAFRVQTHDQFRLVKNMEKYGYSIRFSSPLSLSEYEELREKALEFIRYMDM